MREHTRSGSPPLTHTQEETMTFVPPGFRRVRCVKSGVEYAGQTVEAGRVIFVDVQTAEKLVASKAVELVDVGPFCPKCGSPADAALNTTRWASCANPACQHGWPR
jgi:hypothetical protein